jgi:phosphoglycerol transferase MdoB-like AlkP superfamily enzyme
LFACLFILLLIPSLAARYISLNRNIPIIDGRKARTIYALSWITGVCQDIFIVFQQLFIFYLFQGNWSWIGAILAAILQLDIIFDAFLYKEALIRMEAPFFAFLNDVRCFWDSAKAKGLAFFAPLAVLLFFGIVIAFYFIARVIPFAFDSGMTIFAIVVALVGIAGLLFLPKMVSYAIDNVVLTQEVWILRRIFSKFTKKSRLVRAKEMVEHDLFTSPCEKNTAISPSYPLLKFTHEFTGKKAFDITVAEGEKPNIIFFFMESMRSKDVGVLGGEYGVTPNFDRLSKDGVLFSNFYSNSVKTSRAVTSSLFGVPSDVTSSEVSNSAGRPFISLANILAENGYHTSYLHNGDLSFENQREFFTHYGFEELVGKDEILNAFPNAPTSSWGLPDEYLVKYAESWLENKERENAPQFVTMFTITNHHPWIVPAGFTPPPIPKGLDPRYERYLSTMAYSDAALGSFVDHLRRTGLSKNTILFVLGDHGQPMGEHYDNYVEQRYLFEENIRVPLLILADGRLDKPKIITDIGSQIDLFSTVMDIAKLKGLNHTMGTSLAREDANRRVFFHNPYMYRFYGMRHGDHKLIHMRASKKVELFDLANDPHEQVNIATRHPDLVKSGLADIYNYNHLFQSIYENKLFSP